MNRFFSWAALGAALLSLPAHAIPQRPWRESIDPDSQIFDLPGRLTPPSQTAAAAAATPDPTTPAGLVVLKRTVHGSLQGTLAAMRLPEGVVEDLHGAFAYDPEVRGHVPAGSEVELACERGDASAATAPCARMRSALLRIHGHEHRVYRYSPDGDGNAVLVNEEGAGVSLAPLSDPLPNSRMTSGWGWRIHPVLRHRRFHHGVDYAAPTGTPVLAAEDGTVEEIGRRGHYGDYIRVRHLERLQTAYAHLSGYARELQPGSRVSKGQVIGYVGETGWATGPHLYFEVIVDGERVNPLQNPVALPLQLHGEALSAFERYRLDADRVLAKAAGACGSEPADVSCRQVAHGY